MTITAGDFAETPVAMVTPARLTSAIGDTFIRVYHSTTLIPVPSLLSSPLVIRISGKGGGAVRQLHLTHPRR